MIAGGVLPVARMGFLPVTNSLSVLLVPEIGSILGFPQPSLLTAAFARLLAIGFGAEMLALAIPIVRKKNLFAVQALTLVIGCFHRLQNASNRPFSNHAARPRKKKQGRRSRPAKKEEELSANSQEDPPRRRSISKTPVLHDFHLAPLSMPGSFTSIQLKTIVAKAEIVTLLLGEMGVSSTSSENYGGGIRNVR